MGLFWWGRNAGSIGAGGAGVTMLKDGNRAGRGFFAAPCLVMVRRAATAPMIRPMKIIAMSTVPLLACLSAAAAAEPPLELQIVHRPPYLIVGPDGIDGIAVRPALAAFRKAGIEVTWKEVPALRQLQRLKSNQERVCSVGWYKTAERERFAKFTRAVSQDSPWGAFANLPARPTGAMTVRALLADSRLTVLMKAGFVYGDYLDREIAGMRAQRKESHSDMPQVLKMIEVGRAQLTFAPVEEIQYYLRNSALHTGASQLITFSDMPAGYKRHLMCSMRVDDKLIARFNAALAGRRLKRAR
jgi:hypothetical protein